MKNDGGEFTPNIMSGSNTIDACPRCGARLPEGLDQCVSCGMPGLAGEYAEGPSGDRQTANASRIGTWLAMTVLGVILVLVAIYAVIAGRIHSAPGAADEYGHLPSELAQQVSVLEEEITSESDLERKYLKIDALVNLYRGAERFDYAAEVQRSLAEIVNTAEAWDLAGNLYFDWMLQVQDPERVVYAKYAIDAYVRSLVIDSLDVGVRTDLGAAYMYYPGFLEEAFKQTHRVLSVDSGNVQANFNLGIMLARTRQFEQAMEQFEKIKISASEDDPRYLQANDAIARIRSLETVNKARSGLPADST